MELRLFLFDLRICELCVADMVCNLLILVLLCHLGSRQPDPCSVGRSGRLVADVLEKARGLPLPLAGFPSVSEDL